jgi:predicted nucleic acid-binding protein
MTGNDSNYIVLDVSGSMQILTQGSKYKEFHELINNSTRVFAPDLYIPELTNTLWKCYNAKLLNFDECIQYIEDGIKLIDEYIDSQEIWKEAFGEGVKNIHPVYDMYYAVIARRNNGILITNDSKLARICAKINIAYCI